MHAVVAPAEGNGSIAPGIEGWERILVAPAPGASGDATRGLGRRA